MEISCRLKEPACSSLAPGVKHALDLTPGRQVPTRESPKRHTVHPPYQDSRTIVGPYKDHTRTIQGPCEGVRCKLRVVRLLCRTEPIRDRCFRCKCCISRLLWCAKPLVDGRGGLTALKAISMRSATLL